MALTPDPTFIPYVSQAEVANAADVPNLSEDMANQLHTLISALQQAKDAMEPFLVPVGTIVSFGGTTAPPGWALCNGSPHYSNALSALLPSGADTPDLTSRFVVGAGASAKVPYTQVYNRGNSGLGGATSLLGTRTLSTNEMPAHNHGVNTGNMSQNAEHGHTSPYQTGTFAPLASGWEGNVFNRELAAPPGGYWQYDLINSASTQHAHSIPTDGAGAAFDIRPPYYALVYIIKKGPGTVNGVPYNS